MCFYVFGKKSSQNWFCEALFLKGREKPKVPSSYLQTQLWNDVIRQSPKPFDPLDNRFL